MKSIVSLAVLLACLSPAALAGQSEQISAQAKAQSIHARALVLDTHLDTPLLFARPGWDIMDRHSADADARIVAALRLDVRLLPVARDRLARGED